MVRNTVPFLPSFLPCYLDMPAHHFSSTDMSYYYVSVPIFKSYCSFLLGASLSVTYTYPVAMLTLPSITAGGQPVRHQALRTGQRDCTQCKKLCVQSRKNVVGRHRVAGV